MSEKKYIVRLTDSERKICAEVVGKLVMALIFNKIRTGPMPFFARPIDHQPGRELCRRAGSAQAEYCAAGP